MAFNELDLAGADPPLDLLLAGDGGADVHEFREVYEPRDVVLARETAAKASLVLIYTAREVVGDTRV
jgi:hypothetical protein